MRDVIWTLIVVWLIYKVVDIFRSSSNRRSYPGTADEQSTNQHSYNNNSSSHSEKDVKNAVKKHLNNEGEYVDFEEVK